MFSNCTLIVKLNFISAEEPKHLGSKKCIDLPMGPVAVILVYTCIQSSGICFVRVKRIELRIDCDLLIVLDSYQQSWIISGTPLVVCCWHGPTDSVIRLPQGIQRLFNHGTKGTLSG